MNWKTRIRMWLTRHLVRQDIQVVANIKMERNTIFVRTPAMVAGNTFIKAGVEARC